jgi:hypothetical protein
MENREFFVNVNTYALFWFIISIVFMFFSARFLKVLGTQARVISKTLRLQGMLAVFQILETPEVLQARGIIHKLSEDPESMAEAEFDTRIREMRPALIAFHKVGYLVSGGYVELEPIVAYFWTGVWRSWNKAKGFIQRERKRRNDETYMDKFDYLFQMSEQHRLKHNLPEPGM